MRDTYSVYEAKSKLSAIIRQVREGHPVVVTLHGEPAVEIRAIEAPKKGLAARIEELAARGALVRASDPQAQPRTVARRPGAVARFLADRNE